MCLENSVFITRKRTKIQFIFIQVHSKSELKFFSSSSGQKVNWVQFKVHQKSELLNWAELFSSFRSLHTGIGTYLYKTLTTISWIWKCSSNTSTVEVIWCKTGWKGHCDKTWKNYKSLHFPMFLFKRFSNAYGDLVLYLGFKYL